MDLSRRYECILLVLILASAAGLRLWNLSRAPNGLMPDEASNAYDAWSILTTGADRWGEPHPIFLEAFGRGDYRPALYVYLTVPMVQLMGPKRLELAARLPAALLGILTVAGTYLLVRRVNGPIAALAAAAILTVCPWHLLISRFGHEASLTPLFAVLLMLALQQCAATLESDPPFRSAAWDWTILGLVVGISPYTYASMKLFVPVILIAFAVIYRHRLVAAARDKRASSAILVGAIVCVVIASPMIWATLARWDQVNARAEEQSLFHQGQSISTILAQCAGNWLDHFGPRWLFVRGSDVAFFGIPGVGQLNWFTAPLLLLGLLHICAKRTRSRYQWVLVAWLTFYPVTSALTIGSPHVLRAACGIAAFAWLGGNGASAIIELLSQHRLAMRLTAVAIVAGIVLNGGWASRRYFEIFGRNSQMACLYQADWRVVLESIDNRWESYERVFITDHASVERRWIKDQAYIHVLNYLRIPPHVFQRWQKNVTYVPEDAAFHTILSMGPFEMSTQPAVLSDFFLTWDGDAVLFVARPGDISGGNKLSEVDWPNGEVRFEIVQVGPR